MQISRFRLKLGKLKHIFISHLHGDHYLGLIGLLSTTYVKQGWDKLTKEQKCAIGLLYVFFAVFAIKATVCVCVCVCVFRIEGQRQKGWAWRWRD